MDTEKAASTNSAPSLAFGAHPQQDGVKQTDTYKSSLQYLMWRGFLGIWLLYSDPQVYAQKAFLIAYWVLTGILASVPVAVFIMSGSSFTPIGTGVMVALLVIAAVLALCFGKFRGSIDRYFSKIRGTQEFQRVVSNGAGRH
jgi:hypothetical protein